MKTILSVYFMFCTLYGFSQWSNSPTPTLTSGDAHIENANPYLFLDLNAINSSNGGLWFENQGIDAARITYRPENTFHFSEILGSDVNDIFSLDLEEQQMSPTNGGFVQLGKPSAAHLDIDHNEIQARNGDDSVALYLNYRGGDISLGQDQLYLDDETNYLGIGTDSPSAKLDVRGNVRIQSQLEFRQNNQSSGRIYPEEIDGNKDLTIRSVDAIRFLTNNFGLSPKMFLSNDGDVGIGTITPESTLDVQGNGNFTGELTAASDARFKENVLPISDALEVIQSLNPVSYDFKYQEYSKMNFSKDTRYGLLAQEVENILPALVSKSGNEDYRSLNYIDLIPFLIKAIQEQQIRIQELEKRFKYGQKR